MFCDRTFFSSTAGQGFQNMAGSPLFTVNFTKSKKNSHENKSESRYDSLD